MPPAGSDYQKDAMLLRRLIFNSKYPYTDDNFDRIQSLTVPKMNTPQFYLKISASLFTSVTSVNT